VLPKVENVSKVLTLICRTFFFSSSSRCWRNSLLLLDRLSRTLTSITVSSECVVSLDFESKKRRWNIARFSSNNDNLRRTSMGVDVEGTHSKESELYFVFTLSLLVTELFANFVLLRSGHLDNACGSVEMHPSTERERFSCCKCRSVSEEIWRIV